MTSTAAVPAAQRGTTTVADAVVAKVAALAVHGVAGVHAVGGAGSGARPTRGVVVEVGAQQAAVTVELVAEYGASLPGTAEAVRRSVAEAVQDLTGLDVTSVDVLVSDVHVPGGDRAEHRAEQDAAPAGPRPSHLPTTRTTAR